MIKKIVVLAFLPALIFSCKPNAGKDKNKSGDKKEITGADRPSSEQRDKLVYLDTAENMYNILCQGWVMEDDELALKDMQEGSDFEIAYRSLNFAANGTFVKNVRNAMDYGKWDYDDAKKLITLHYANNGGKDTYKIAALAPDEMKLLNTGINTSTILKFISSGKRLKNPDDEPFSVENNRWRISSNRPETDTDIRRRLKENLHFFILFYRSVIIRDDRTVSFWGLPSCFKWYGGGIYLKKEDELKDNWVECFYNKEQAMKAYRMAEKLLEQKYDWPKDEPNWLKLNLAVLEQMYERIDQVK